MAESHENNEYDLFAHPHSRFALAHKRKTSAPVWCPPVVQFCEAKKSFATALVHPAPAPSPFIDVEGLGEPATPQPYSQCDLTNTKEPEIIRIPEESDDSDIFAEAINDMLPKGTNGETPLLRTISGSKIPADEKLRQIRKLLDLGSKPNDANDQGETALILAVRYRCTEVVQALIKHGADPSIQDTTGRSALHHAVSLNLKEVIQLLIDKCCDQQLLINQRDERGCTPLLLASMLSYTDCSVIKKLLNMGANPSIEDLEGRHPVHWAAMHNNTTALKMLLATGIDLHAQDNKGQTAFFLAARDGNRETLQLLREHGASLKLGDDLDRLPTDIAKEKGRDWVLELLSKQAQGPEILPINNSLVPLPPLPPLDQHTNEQSTPRPAQKRLIAVPQPTYLQPIVTASQQEQEPSAPSVSTAAPSAAPESTTWLHEPSAFRPIPSKTQANHNVSHNQHQIYPTCRPVAASAQHLNHFT